MTDHAVDGPTLKKSHQQDPKTNTLQRPSEIRRMLEANDMLVDDAPPDDGPLAPRQSYNFAPTYHGVVLRAADAPSPQDSSSTPTDTSSSPQKGTTPNAQKQHYILQTMKWGLIPSWTGKTTPQKQASANPLKTINCRAESLASSALWSRLRDKRRCVILADGFYEWLKTGPGGKQRLPYYVKRRDGRPMCFAGLWDYVPPRKEGGEGGEGGEGEGVYTYTIITTTSCKALNFLHDRMPVLMEAGGEEMRRWLGVGAGTWDMGVAGLLKPWDVDGGLEVYRVSADVGKVGRDEKRFVERVEGGRGDIAGWFKAEGKGGGGEDGGGKGGDGEGGKAEDGGEGAKGKDVEVEVKDEEGEVKREMKSVDEVEEEGAAMPEKGVKRDAEDEAKDEPPKKKMMGLASPSPVKSRPKISATRNVHKSPKKGVKGKADGSQKITKFFGNSA